MATATKKTRRPAAHARPRHARKAAPPQKHPTPVQIRRQREAAGLTQGEAAGILHTTLRAYQQWEAEAGTAGHRNMHPAFWELFQLKTADMAAAP